MAVTDIQTSKINRIDGRIDTVMHVVMEGFALQGKRLDRIEDRLDGLKKIMAEIKESVDYIKDNMVT